MKTPQINIKKPENTTSEIKITQFQKNYNALHPTRTSPPLDPQKTDFKSQRIENRSINKSNNIFKTHNGTQEPIFNYLHKNNIFTKEKYSKKIYSTKNSKQHNKDNTGYNSIPIFKEQRWINSMPSPNFQINEENSYSDIYDQFKGSMGMESPTNYDQIDQTNM